MGVLIPYLGLDSMTSDVVGLTVVGGPGRAKRLSVPIGPARK